MTYKIPRLYEPRRRRSSQQFERGMGPNFSMPSYTLLRSSQWRNHNDLVWARIFSTFLRQYNNIYKSTKPNIEMDLLDLAVWDLVVRAWTVMTYTTTIEQIS